KMQSTARFFRTTASTNSRNQLREGIAAQCIVNVLANDEGRHAVDENRQTFAVRADVSAGPICPCALASRERREPTVRQCVRIGIGVASQMRTIIGWWRRSLSFDLLRNGLYPNNKVSFPQATHEHLLFGLLFVGPSS